MDQKGPTKMNNSVNDRMHEVWRLEINLQDKKEIGVIQRFCCKRVKPE